MDHLPHAQIALLSGSSHPALARAVAEHLGVALTAATTRTFSSGETSVRVEDSVRGADAFVIQAHTPPVNDHLVEHLLLVDALRRASAKSITAVLPFYPYARQDRKGLNREPISARLVAEMYRAAGADRLITVDLHTAQIQGFFDGPVDHLYAMPILTDCVRERYHDGDVTVVSPDAGRVKVAERWTDRLECPLAIIHKRRDGDQVSMLEVVGDVAGRTCVLIDDMIDTAGTITHAAEVLKVRGARRVVAVATHGVLSGPALERLESSEIDEVVLTDTLPTAAAAAERSTKFHVVSAAPFIARSIDAVFAGASVSTLFTGSA